MMTKNRLTGIVLLALFAGMGMSGCLAGADDDPCDGYYPDGEELSKEKYRGWTASQDEAMIARVQAFWSFENEHGGEWPGTFMKWDDWPEETRPELLEDLLCGFYGRALIAKENHPDRPEWPHGQGGYSVLVHEDYGEPFLDAVWAEYERQTGYGQGSLPDGLRVWLEWEGYLYGPSAGRGSFVQDHD